MALLDVAEIDDGECEAGVGGVGGDRGHREGAAEIAEDRGHGAGLPQAMDAGVEAGVGEPGVRAGGDAAEVGGDGGPGGGELGARGGADGRALNGMMDSRSRSWMAQAPSGRIISSN